MENRLFVSFKRKLGYVIFGLLILGFHSCGMVSRVREQGESKSWVVSGPTNAERSYSKRSVSDGEEVTSTYVNPLITTSIALFSISESSQIESEVHVFKVAKTENQTENKTKSELLTESFLKSGSFNADFPKMIIKRKVHRENELSIKSTQQNNQESPKTEKRAKNRSLLIAGGTVLLVLLTMIIASEATIWYAILFSISTILCVLSIIHLFQKPKPSIGAAILSVLLNILNLLGILLSLVFWAFSGGV
jgi:hypothetical protein